MGLFDKKIKINLYEEGFGWKKLNGKIHYDSKLKIWFLTFKEGFFSFKAEKIPAREDIFQYVIGNQIFLIRRGPNTYEFLKIAPREKKIEASPISSDEIYSYLTEAQVRFERMKSMLERLAPYFVLTFVVVLSVIAVAIVWQSVGQNMSEISKNFKDAMNILQNITTTQNELIREIRGVRPLPGG